MQKTKYIDINGTGNSGKSTITDLLREFEGVFLYDHLFEFDLIRIQGGLIDLKHNIHDYWSPIRADYAVQRFMKTAKRLSNSNFEQIQSKIESYGTNYEKIFNNKFIEETEKYVNSLFLKTVDRE